MKKILYFLLPVQTLLAFTSYEQNTEVNAVNQESHIVISETKLNDTPADSSAGWLFIDDFVDNRNNWPVYYVVGESKTEFVKDISFKITNWSVDYRLLAKKIPKLDDSHTFRIETKIDIGSESEGFSGNGLIFGADDNLNNYFAFFINKDGNYKIVHYSIANDFIKLKDWTASNKIYKAGATNKLAVVSFQKKWIFYINGFSVYTMDKQVFAGNKVGFLIGPNGTLYTNSLKIYDWDEAFGKTVQKEPIYESILLDNFISNINGWEESDGQYARLKIENNEYKFEHKVPGMYTSIVNSSREDVNNTFVKAVLRQDKGPDNVPYGICFGMKDIDNMYGFGVSTNGYFIISEWNKGNIKTIKDWTESTAIKTGYYSYNELIVENENDKWVFKINGQIVYECPKMRYHGYNYGLYVEDVSTAGFIHFSVIKKVYPK